jgi:hypothetical protein
MSGRNWDRPVFRTRGRDTESINGQDIPAEFRSAPQAATRSKAEQRAEAERAVREFNAKRRPEQRPPIAADGKPPWED